MKSKANRTCVAPAKVGVHFPRLIWLPAFASLMDNRLSRSLLSKS